MQGLAQLSRCAVALLGMQLGVAIAQTPSATLPSTSTSAVPTFESVGLYWQNPGGTAGCEVKYRKSTETAWRQGLPMWYDARDGQCRGSLVHLAPGTWYQVEFNLPGQAATRGLVVRTWANQYPVAQTVTVGSANGTTLNITQGGSPSGYVVYDGRGAVLDGVNSAQYNVTINASYVILRGLNLRGAKQDAIRISPNVTDVVIEDNDISGWGRTRGGGLAMDMDSGIRAVCSAPTLERLVIQRNRIHDPRYPANSWSDGHPAGAQAITISYCGGNHVVRHNEIYSSANRFNDAIGGEDNYTTTGFPNRDSDIYGNRISMAWDDGIEAEGGNKNVRIWGNYVDRTGTGIATTITSIGPLYVFRNVWNRNQFYERTTSDADSRQPMFKSGSDASLGHGRRYVFHNTMLQATQAGSAYPLGGGAGVGGTGTTQMVSNTVSKNNIYHLYKSGSPFYQIASTSSFERDLYNGTASVAVVSGLSATPVYAAGHGWQNEAGGMYQLAAGTPGYDQGVRIANFNDSFAGAGPDVGAAEAGAGAMAFGISGSPGPSVTATSGGGGVTGQLVTRYRLYSATTFEHLYTTDLNEYNTLPACCAWTPEGAAYRVFNGQASYNGVATVPYYRLYNPNSHQHHWTTDANEYNVLPGMGWLREGVDGHILPSQAAGSVPLYRLYLNAHGGLHHWTIDLNEVNVLRGSGWLVEGIAGYVVPL